MATTVSRRQKRAQAKARKERVTFKYIFDDLYNPEYANGAYGGLTTQGEINLNFYVERMPIPYSESHVLTKEGRVAESLQRNPAMQDGETEVVRFITAGVIMSLDTARNVYTFLGKALETAEQLKQQRTQVQGLVEEKRKQ